MGLNPHRDKLVAAINNKKAKSDKKLLEEAYEGYESWAKQLGNLKSKGNKRVEEMTSLLNDYKDFLEVDLIAKKGSPFIKRQKGQMKLDNSIMEEFLIHLVHDDVLKNLPKGIETGSQTAFMSLSFRPSSIKSLIEKPEIVLKQKDQDFTIGKSIYYQLSPDDQFGKKVTTNGKLFLAVLAAEVKVNYDKTMFQECAGTAARLKQGCPLSKYYALVEYLDMQAEDVRLTDIDNVFLLRKAKRLPYEKRSIFEEVRDQHRNFPISADVMKNFVQEIQHFINATWYDPEEALERGSFS
ncbi:Bpu10I family restriction endonuclease [Salegentibacter mishustinae]|uniref:Bpu10I family restriction endonuclease n=1 Tax=Salegentibacter mishustinae TaxID=270918 RepID=UPI001CE0EA7A|nr:Bpu10I family restriction endonuclease [Salegentibacter mishustinae]UBZ05492.1 Bpu10I family restriction endonuclease [Salegentibacter mishustinae]